MPEPERPHILTSFSQGLGLLRDNLLMMASLTERSVTHASNSLFRRDATTAKICVADDSEIDQLEIEVDRLGVDVLLRFSPVATDLRRVVTAMKIAQNLERISDAAVGISRKLLKILKSQAELPEIDLLLPLSEESSAMFRESVRCYHLGDSDGARLLKQQDKSVDRLAKEIGERLTRIMTNDPSRVPPLLELVFITRHFERLGDHATNIAEDVVFEGTNEDIRHQ